MKRPNRIALLLAGLLPALAGRTQELPGCMTPGVRAEMGSSSTEEALSNRPSPTWDGYARNSTRFSANAGIWSV